MAKPIPTSYKGFLATFAAFIALLVIAEEKD